MSQETAVVFCALAVIVFFAYHGVVLVIKYLKRSNELSEYAEVRKELEDEIYKGNAALPRAQSLRERLHTLESDLGWR